MPIVLFLSLFFGIEGLIVGSFLNVVIDRAPHHKSLGGRSSCDSCGRKLTIRELVPVLSYLWQKGKSACCKQKLKWQYPLVEGFTGLLFFLTSWFYLTVKVLPSHSYLQLKAFPLPSMPTVISLIGLLLVVMASIAIIITDFKHHIIPDGQQVILIVGSTLFLWLTQGYSWLDVSLGLLVIVGLYALGESLANFKKVTVFFFGSFLFLVIVFSTGIFLLRPYLGQDILTILDVMGTYLILLAGMLPFVTRVFGAFLVALPILLLYLVTLGRGMGYGDVKLQFGLGLLLGLSTGFLGLYIGFLVGALFGGILMLLKKANRKSHIAFGPFLLIGAWTAFWVGEFLIQTIKLYF